MKVKMNPKKLFKLVLLIYIFVAFFESLNNSKEETQEKIVDGVAFSPSNKCENMIINLIKESSTAIDVVVYSINNDNIVEALKKAHDKGVKLRILTDKTQASNKYSKVFELYKYGINIKVHSKHKIEHNKFAVFDGKYVTSGSYNWTNPATTKNSENCIFFVTNKSIIEDYKSRFDYLWQINQKKKSDDWFKSKKKTFSKN